MIGNRKWEGGVRLHPCMTHSLRKSPTPSKISFTGFEPGPLGQYCIVLPLTPPPLPKDKNLITHSLSFFCWWQNCHPCRQPFQNRSWHHHLSKLFECIGKTLASGGVAKNFDTFAKRSFLWVWSKEPEFQSLKQNFFIQSMKRLGDRVWTQQNKAKPLQ